MRVSRLCFTAMLVALGTAPAHPAFANQGSPEDALRLADGRDPGDYRTTLIKLKNAVRSNPNNAEARFQLGRLEFQGGDFVAAEKELTQAREIGFPEARIAPLLANLYLAEGKFQQLLTTIPPCPDDTACKSEVLALRARADLALRNPDEADRESRAALDVDPISGTAGTTRAMILMTRNDNVGAEQLIDALLARTPANSEALSVKGDLRRQAGDTDAAIRAYRAAIEINPGDVRARQSLALALMAVGRDDEARPHIDLVLERNPKAPMALYLKAALLIRAKKVAEALDTVRPAEAEIAQFPQGAFLLALIHLSGNNLEEAFKYATIFHATEPDSLVGAKLLANVNFRLHAYSKVISILAPLRDHLGADGEALDLLGSAYLAEGRVQEANDLLSEAAKARPDNPMVRTRLAVSRTQQSSTRDEGIRELESIIRDDPKNLRADLALISTYIGGGDYDRAIAAATDMANNQPASSLPLTLRGAARLAKEDGEGAWSDFEAALAKNPDFAPAALYLTEMDMQAGRFADARLRLDDLLKRSPTDLRVLLARAQVEERSNKPAAAVPFLETAISDHPSEIEPRIQLMRAESALGDREKLAITATDLARTQAANPSAVDLAARTLISAGKTENGLNLYRLLQSSFPDVAQTHEQYGLTLARLGREDEARAAFDQALAVDQHRISAWAYRIAVEMKMNGLDAAMVIAEKAKSKNPDNPAAAVLPADLLWSAGKLDAAEASYRKAFEQKPSTVTAIHLFQALARKGDDKAADTLLEGWIKHNPKDLDVRIALAAHKSFEGAYRDAVIHYQAVALALPRNAAILNNLAWAYDHVDDPRALEVAKRAYSMSPDNPAIIDTYGYILYRGGDRTQGRELVRRAFDANPNDPQVAYHMAKLLVDGKDPKGARDILKGLVESKVAFEGVDEARQLYSELNGS